MEKRGNKTMKTCTHCGNEIPDYFKGDKCLECSRASIRKIFAENPEVKQAFHETIEEMKKPENMKKMVDDTCNAMAKFQNMKKE